jgi:hypothetical protein
MSPMAQIHGHVASHRLVRVLACLSIVLSLSLAVISVFLLAVTVSSSGDAFVPCTTSTLETRELKVESRADGNTSKSRLPNACASYSHSFATLVTHYATLLDYIMSVILVLLLVVVLSIYFRSTLCCRGAFRSFSRVLESDIVDHLAADSTRRCERSVFRVVMCVPRCRSSVDFPLYTYIPSVLTRIHIILCICLECIGCDTCA